MSKTGLQAQETKLQVIANNLANVNTTGFKRDSAVFEDQFYEMARLPGSNTGGDNQSLSGMQLGTGVRFAATHKEFSQGKLQTTGNETDLAINGNGFFQVTLPSGDIAYTRAGNLGWNSEGVLSSMVVWAHRWSPKSPSLKVHPMSALAPPVRSLRW